MHKETVRKAEPLGLTSPEKLNDTHDVSKFECSEPSINDYLKGAKKQQVRKNAVVYVCCEVGTNVVRAFYTLSSGSVVRDDAIKRMQRNAPKQIPITILGRLGVDIKFCEKGVGSDLLKDAVERSMKAAELVGSQALMVQALNEKAALFYEKRGFVMSELAENTLFISLR